MSPLYIAISSIKQSNMSKEQRALFLLNVSKEALLDYLIESNIEYSTKLTKKKMIELIINNGMITVDKDINILPINTEKVRISDK